MITNKNSHLWGILKRCCRFSFRSHKKSNYHNQVSHSNFWIIQCIYTKVVFILLSIRWATALSTKQCTALTCCSFYISCGLISHFCVINIISFLKSQTTLYCMQTLVLQLPHPSLPSQTCKRVQNLFWFRLWFKKLVTCFLFPSNHWHFLHISNKTASLSYHSCVHWSSTFSFLQELFLCIYNLAVHYKRLSFWFVLAFNMAFSLSLVISTFSFKVRDVLLSYTWILRSYCSWLNFNIAFREEGDLRRRKKGIPVGATIRTQNNGLQ